MRIRWQVWCSFGLAWIDGWMAFCEEDAPVCGEKHLN